MPPRSRRCRYSGSPNPTRRRRLFGEPTPSPQYLRWHVFGRSPSPEVYMGRAPCPQDRTLPLFGRMPEPQSGGRKLFGEPTPSPQYLRWHVFGRCPSPRVYMGSAPCPHVRRCRYSGCRTHQEDAGYLGSQPQAPNISDGVYLGVAQAPGCIWGAPHAPDIIFHSLFFTFHFYSHDTELQLERHGVLSTAYRAE